MMWIALVILAIFLTSYFVLLQTFTTKTYRHTIDYAINIDKSVLNEALQIKKMGENTSDSLLGSPFTQDALGTEEPTVSRSDFKVVLNNMTLYHGLNNILAIGRNGVAHSTNWVLHPDQVYDAFLERCQNRLDPLDRRNKWLPLETNVFYQKEGGTNYPALYIYRAVYNLNRPNELLGHMLIQYKGTLFEPVLEKLSREQGENYVLVNEENRVMASTSAEIPVSVSMDERSEELQYVEPGVYETPDNTQAVVITEDDCGWKLYHTIAYSTLFREIYRSKNITLVAVLLTAAGVFIALRNITKSIILPIRDMERTMQSFGRGNLNARICVDRNDEIGHCETCYNDMGDQIKKLMEDIEQRKQELQRLEMDILTYQINPHFLYNTLDSINWMAQRAKQKEISQVVTELARFFRISLNINSENHLVANEVEHAQRYLHILKIRYNDRFDYRIDADPEVMEESSLHFILQPVIENFFKHGFKPDEQNELHISIYKENDCIIYDVMNNGRMIETDFLATLNKDLQEGRPSKPGKSVGLHNINRRIQLYYGINYGVHIENGEATGVLVKIRIPIKKQTNCENIKIEE